METAKFYEQTANDREAMTRIAGRFINGINNLFVGVGWAPLLTEMEKRLSAIDPDYTLLSIIDHEGVMRITFDASRPFSDEDMTAAEWDAAQIAADERQDLMADVAREIELKSATVCEMTGSAGSPVFMDGRTYTLSPEAAAYYERLDSEGDDEVIFEFPTFTAVFQFDGEPAEATILDEREVRILASLGRKAAQSSSGQPSEGNGVTIGYLDYDDYDGLINLDGTDYTIDQIGEMVTEGIHEALHVALRDIFRDTENAEHGA